MTYVSRRTRIIVSRWSEECILGASRKRSDGRLKNYSSCDDLRAWINDNCIKNEYLVDLMTKDEFSDKPQFALYGRFIPVPILFKLLQNGKSDEEKKGREESGKIITSEKGGESGDLNRVEWEKKQAEKNLLDCVWLLNTAVRKLEKIENIIDITKNQTETSRTKEIQEVFRQAKATCTCGSENQSTSFSSSNNASDCYTSSQKKSARDSAMYNELTKTLIQLDVKFNEVEACRCEIANQIRKTQRCGASGQMMESLSQKDQNLIKKLQKKQENLIAEKGKILIEMCHILKSLNTLKVFHKSHRSSRKTNRNSDANCKRHQKHKRCNCGCKTFQNYESSDSENVGYSEVLVPCEDKLEQTNDFGDIKEYPEKLAIDYDDQKPEKLYSGLNPVICSGSQKLSTTNAPDGTCSSCKSSNQDSFLNSSQEKVKKLKEVDGEKKEPIKKSKVKFVCESSSEKNLYNDDLSAFESSLSSEQKAVILKTVNSMKNQRPSTSPTTEREKRESSLKQLPLNSSKHAMTGPKRTCLRKIKSESTIKDFEKTLRNYERRLNNLESLECKLENLKQKSTEVCRLKRKLAKVKVEVKKQRAADKEKFNLEVTRLCSVNWELKKQFQQLVTKYQTQNKMIQTLKCSAIKTKELECEAEDLKKDLSEYREGFEHQRKRISKLENVVAMQRTEIENLMNYITKLTAAKDDTRCRTYHDKKTAQRSRSFSPEIGKEKSRSSRQMKPKMEEEEVLCYCGEHSQMEGRKRIHQRNPNRSCFDPSNGNINW